jgi:hypothetical protein
MSVRPEKDTGGSTTTVEPLLVNEDTAAAMLGVSPRTVWQLGKVGVLVTGRIGRRKNYLVSSLKAYAKRITEVA